MAPKSRKQKSGAASYAKKVQIKLKFKAVPLKKEGTRFLICVRALIVRALILWRVHVTAHHACEAQDDVCDVAHWAGATQEEVDAAVDGACEAQEDAGDGSQGAGEAQDVTGDTGDFLLSVVLDGEACCDKCILPAVL
jgi:hypothetical protein